MYKKLSIKKFDKLSKKGKEKNHKKLFEGMGREKNLSQKNKIGLF